MWTNQKELKALGYPSMLDFDNYLKESFPLKIDKENSKWLSGCALLVDPSISKQWTCCYSVGENLTDSMKLLKELKV